MFLLLLCVCIKILYNQEKDSLRKSAFKAFSLPTFFVQVGLGVAVAFASLFLVASLSILIPFLGSFKDKVSEIECLITVGVGFLLGVVFGMIFQKKNAVMSILFAAAVLVLITAFVIAM